MKTVLVFFFLVFSFVGKAQNLVVNGDFELYDTCPNNFSFPGADQIHFCSNWKTPTFATSDYYNECATGTPVNVPYSEQGFQEAYSGNGFCGIIPISQTDGWVEYIQGQVNSLERDKIYKLSLQVSLANSSIYGFSKLGIHLGDSEYTNYSTTFPIASMIPQFETPESTLIRDTAEWQNFEWYFIASGEEKWITIGVFDEISNLDTITVNTDGTNFCYVYIDQVKIELANNSNEITANVFTPNKDGINDYWQFALKSTGSNKILIYNRWGNLIRNEDLENFLWDGTTSQGEKCEEGVYYYVINTDYSSFHGFIELRK